jgi:hypothetical protein
MFFLADDTGNADKTDSLSYTKLDGSHSYKQASDK